MKWVIYTLTNPRTNEVRYVGWTSKTPARRLNTHIQAAVSKPAATHRARWILSLLSIGIRPVMTVIESGEGDGWREAERRWIAFFREEGARLVNGTDGGDGTPGLKQTPENTARFVAMVKSRVRSPEEIKSSVERLRAINLGRKLSPDHRRKLLESTMGREVSSETRAKLSAALKGRQYSETTRAQMSEAAKKRKATPETRAKMAAAHQSEECLKGIERARSFKKPQASEETRARISAAAKARPPEHYRKIAETRRGMKVSAEGRANMIKAQQARRARERSNSN